MSFTGCLRFGKGRGGIRCGGDSGCGAFQHDNNRIAIYLGRVLDHFCKVEHHPRAAVGLTQPDRAQVALIDILRIFSQAVDSARKIECDPRRVVHGKRRRWIGRGLLESEFHRHAA